MGSITITNARKNLYRLVQEVNDTHTPVEITGKYSNAVLFGENDWRIIQEPVYLSSISGMSESIREELTDELDW